jgi:hypothetical protein
MLTNEQKEILRIERQINEIEKRKSRYEYLGILSEYQLQPEIMAQCLDYTKLNPTQHFLFKRVLHGLNVYTPEERSKLHWDKARRIKKVWQRGQREVNAWKQVITAKKVQPIFSIFTGTPLGRALAAFPIDETDPTVINKISFKDLGIKYEDLILFYMKKGLLPRNYLTLK